MSRPTCSCETCRYLDVLLASLPTKRPPEWRFYDPPNHHPKAQDPAYWSGIYARGETPEAARRSLAERFLGLRLVLDHRRLPWKD